MNNSKTNAVVYKLLHSQLLTGNDLAEAQAFVKDMGLFPDSEITAAADELRTKLGRIYNFNDPISLTANDRVNFHRWYVGPAADSTKWNSLKKFLQAEGRTNSDLEIIDGASTRVVSLLPAPGTSQFSGRGLVMGYVQSGKTTNFMSVAAKCADEGYRLIVVLSGVTNNLRDQTQSRLFQAFNSESDLHWHWLTGSKSDFSPTMNAANTLSTIQNRTVMVIKKNAGRLQKLLDWLATVPPEIRATVPMVIIDDEADQASVNTAKGRTRRTAINDRLLKLMDPSLMPRHTYVGYTATPFANLLIDPNEPTDLFPRDFIVSLAKGDGYFGAEQLFGRDVFDDNDAGACEGSDIIRKISNDDRLKLGTAASVRRATSAEMPESLATAVIWFLLATAARRYRANKNQWSSMLVHSSGRVAAHKEMEGLISAYLSEIRNLSRDAFDDLFESVWIAERDSGSEFRGQNYQPEFGEISSLVHDLAANVKLIVDNNQSQDRLDYEEGNPENPIIVVGGNTLARGLTLEGLISSYFLRTSNAYDALLQMGRWFGYRPGYEDLQRIWMQSDLVSWFSDLATVEAEIRSQIEQYSADEITPLQVPVLIRTHPKMRVTSAAKMFDAVQARVGLSTARLETILFDTDNGDWLEKNLRAGRTFVDRVVNSGISFDAGISGTAVARNVPFNILENFIEEYQFFEDARRVNKETILRYISHVQGNGELEYWNVMLITKSDPDRQEILFDYGHDLKVSKLNRAAVQDDNRHKNIKALASPSDAAKDIPLEFREEFERISGKLGTTSAQYLGLREDAGYSKRGLIGLYIVDKDSKPRKNVRPASALSRVSLDAKQDLLGITFFFPKSLKIDASVDYIGPRPVKEPEEIDVEQDSEDYLADADKMDEKDEE